MVKTKPKYRYYAICKTGTDAGMRTLGAVYRKNVSKLEHKFGEGTIVIGIPESLDRHHHHVIEPILKLFTNNFGEYELVKRRGLDGKIVISQT